jgi:hypothetical protein
MHARKGLRGEAQVPAGALEKKVEVLFMRSRQRKAMSPVPPATSRMRVPGSGFKVVTNRSFQYLLKARVGDENNEHTRARDSKNRVERDFVR